MCHAKRIGARQSRKLDKSVKWVYLHPPNFLRGVPDGVPVPVPSGVLNLVQNVVTELLLHL